MLQSMVQCAKDLTNDCTVLEEEVSEWYWNTPSLWQMQGICDFHIDIDIPDPKGLLRLHLLSH